MAEEAVFPIRYPTDTSGLSKGISELDRLRAALQEDQKQIAGLQKAMASLKLDPDVQAFQKMQAEIKKLSAAEEAAAANLKKLQAQRADMVKRGTSADKLAEFDVKGGEAVGKLWKTQERLQGLKKSLAGIETKPAVQQFRLLEAGLKDAESSLAANQSKFLALGGDMTKMGDKVKSGWDKMADGAEQAGIGVGGIKAKFESLKALGPAGIIVAVVVAVTTLGVVLAKTAYDLTKFALEAGDAARSLGIMMEAAAGSQSGGKELGTMVRRLRNDFAGSREEIAGMVLELKRSGMQGAYLEKTVRLVGIATKTMGEAAGGILKGLVERGAMTKRFVLNPFDLRGTGIKFDDVARQLAKMTGRTIGTAKAALQNGAIKLADGIQALEAAVNLRLGDLAKRQLIALPEQIARARENIKDIFASVDPGKFLTGLARVLDLLDETTDTGKALRSVAKSIFQPILDFVGSNVMPLVRAFFIGATLAVIELSIATLKAYIWLKKTFGDSSIFKGIDGAKIAMYAGAAAVGAFVAVVLGLTLAFAALGVVIAIATFPIWGIGLALVAVAAAGLYLYDELTTALDSISEYFEDFDLEDTVLGITNGIINGIKDAGSAVAEAFKNLARSGVDAFKSALGIASPAKVLRAEAKWIGPGVALGVDDGQKAVEQSMRHLVEPSDAIPAGRGNGSLGGQTIVNQTINVMLQANENGRLDKASSIQTLAEALEDAARQLGLMPVTP